MRVRVVLAVLAVSGGFALGAAPALARSNAASTQSYVQDNYALVRVARSHLATSEAGPLHVLAQVRRECPNAGAGSPQDPESTQMSDEVIGAMVLSAAKPDVQAIRTFTRAAGALSWSNHALTGAVHAYAGKLQTVLGLPTPNLCADVNAWAADGYRALPASTVSFVAKFMPAWVALGYLPAPLARYESSAARALARSSAPLEGALSEGEARAVEHWGAIMDTLELWP
ncbi:MAG TPA: hypothetical protein VGX72_01560 [Solirubrobacteraceae bacterium]|nr:hypothetical protein [Solirubrobacteraceae bacterium]